METNTVAFEGEVDFPSLETPAIIAFKGLPCTLKTQMASIIAKWARSPVLCIDDFLSPEASENSNTVLSSRNDAHQLLRHAFDLLCTVSERQVKYSKFNCVVIKSRLCSTFELDRLIELMISSESHALLIIECHVSNDFYRQIRFDTIYQKDKRWYKPKFWYTPKNWNEVKKAKAEYDARAWDRHFEESVAKLPREKQHLIKRLVLDISVDFDALVSGSHWPNRRIARPFADTIRYLLSKDTMVRLPNSLIFDEQRRAVLERQLNTLREKSKHLCAGEYGCVFKYCEVFEGCCWACEKPISGSSYACYFCRLVLHKSCAEEPKMDDISNATPYLDKYEEEDVDEFEHKYYHFKEKHTCDYCEELGKPFSYECRSCLFLTHLKCRLMPTIVYHVCHSDHFLSIWIKSDTKTDQSPCSFCKGCSYGCHYNRYICVTCNYSYHIKCVAAPREVDHEHAGYKHVMKMMYSLDGIEEQEDFWCDICYKDINPIKWFYYCKECPYYISHMDYPTRLPCDQRQA